MGIQTTIITHMLTIVINHGRRDPYSTKWQERAYSCKILYKEWQLWATVVRTQKLGHHKILTL